MVVVHIGIVYVSYNVILLILFICPFACLFGVSMMSYDVTTTQPNVYNN